MAASSTVSSVITRVGRVRGTVIEPPGEDDPIPTEAVAGGEARTPDLVWEVGERMRLRTVWQHQASSDPTMDFRVAETGLLLLRSWLDDD